MYLLPFQNVVCQQESLGSYGWCVWGERWAVAPRPHACLLLAGLAVGLGFGALAEVAKKSLRPDDPSGELGP